jgi:hypothetical protein
MKVVYTEFKQNMLGCVYEGSPFTSLQRGRYVVCLSVCPQHIARKLAWDRTLTSVVTSWWHDTASLKVRINVY